MKDSKSDIDDGVSTAELVASVDVNDGLWVQTDVSIICDILAIDEDQLLLLTNAQFVLYCSFDQSHANFGRQKHLS